MFSTIGLLIIALSWLIQLAVAQKKGRVLTPFFPALYALGVLLMLIDNVSSGSTNTAYLNLISLLAALAVLLMTGAKKR